MKFLLVFSLLFTSFLPNTPTNWHTEYKANSLTVVSTTEKGDSYKTYKGTLRIKSPQDTIFTIMRNIQDYPTWQFGNLKSELLSPSTTDNILPKVIFDTNNQYTFYVYSINEGAPLDDRDAVARVEMTKFDDGKVILDVFGALDYLPKQNDLVRLTALKGKWIFERDSQQPEYAIITHQMYNDPDVPMWIPNASINASTYDLVKKTLENLEQKLSN